jgi:hypothetical protein
VDRRANRDERLRHSSLASPLRNAVLGVAILLSAAASASDLPTKKPAPPPPAPVVQPSPWRFELTGYGWASSLSGYAGIRNFPALPFYAGFPKIVEHLGGVFMGAATASNGTFIVGVDFIWSRLVGSSTFRDPSSALYGTQADITLNEAVATALGGVRLPVGPPMLVLYAIGGVRWFGTSDSLTLTHPVSGFENHASLRKDWIDPVVGFTARYRIDGKWFINTEADIGGLSNSATGQALAAVGYNWTSSIATTAGYRALYTYDRQDTGGSGSFRYQQWMYGPYVAFKYGF